MSMKDGQWVAIKFRDEIVGYQEVTLRDGRIEFGEQRIDKEHEALIEALNGGADLSVSIAAEPPAEWRDVLLVREPGGDVELPSPAKQSKSGSWEYRDYMPKPENMPERYFVHMVGGKLYRCIPVEEIPAQGIQFDDAGTRIVNCGQRDGKDVVAHKTLPPTNVHGPDGQPIR